MSPLVHDQQTRKEYLPDDLQPFEHISAESLGAHIECYQNTPKSKFSLPPHTHHWLIIQEAEAPSDFQVKAEGVEYNLATFAGENSVIYIPPYHATEWDFTPAKGSVHIFLPDTLIHQAIQSHGVPSPNCFFNQLKFIAGSECPIICKEARKMSEKLRAHGDEALPRLEQFFLCITERFLCLQVNHHNMQINKQLIETPQFNKKILHQMDSFIENNLTNCISVEEMAQIAGMSPYHFSRCFRTLKGLSPYNYVKTIRVQKARSLLAQSSKSLVEIANLCGFSDQSHMSRSFKSVLNYTPGKYRKYLPESEI